MTTGEKIKTARQNLGYTQEQLAEKISVSRQAIAKWESDRGLPDIENLKAIAEFFDLSVDDLINNDFQIEKTEDTERAVLEDALQTEENQEGPLKEKKKLVPVLSVVMAVVLLLTTIFVIVPAIKRGNAFKTAEQFEAEGKYEEAATIYGSIGTKKSQEKYRECGYNHAKQLYAQGKYEEALLAISFLSYKDSEELEKAWKYEYALLNVKYKNYPKAIELLKELEDYNDSESKLDEVYRYYGAKLYNQKEFEKARENLLRVSFDSNLRDDWYNSLLQKVTYNYAIDLHNQGFYGKAFNEFNSLAAADRETGESKNALAEEKAKAILKTVLKSTSIWTYTKDAESLTVSLIFSDALGENKLYMYFIAPDGTVTNSFLFKYGITSSKLGIILAALSEDVEGFYCFEFDFMSSSKVRIHIHETTKADECGGFCGTYESETPPDFSSYTTKYDYDFQEVDLPKLSFENEVINPPTDNKEEPKEEITSSDIQSSEETETTESENISSKEDETETESSKVTEASSSRKENTEEKPVSKPADASSSKPNASSSSKPASSSVPASSSKVEVPSEPEPPKDPCAEGHDWKEITSIVHHEEEGHYESVIISEEKKWYRCPVCLEEKEKLEDYYSHFDSSHTDPLEALLRENFTKGTIPAEYEDKWIVDAQAYDETVIDGYECKVCGETK